MRVKNSIRNIVTGVFGQVLNILVNFVVRTVFIATLSEAYLGINGLFTSLLTILSFMELGIGGALYYAMYKPMAERDLEKVQSLLRLYRAAYRIIGFAMFFAGLAMLPFLSYLVRGSTDLVDLRLVFVLYLLESATSYWFFAYYSAVLYTDQKNYVIALIHYVASLATMAARLVILLSLRGTPGLCFYCYSAMGVVANILKNLLVRARVRKLYPWTRDNRADPLPREEKRAFFKNVVGTCTNKICKTLNDGIDNTIISAYVGLSAVGVYSNYLALKIYVNRFLSAIFSAMTASIGDLCAVESQEKKESFFRTLQFTYFWVYGFCAICFWTLYNAFIDGVWLRDTRWLLPDRDVFLIVFNFLLLGLTEDVSKYRDVNGLYWQTKYRYVLSSLLNVGLSIFLTGPAGLGITGALLGTTASTLVLICYDPVLVYRHVFHKSAGVYYRTYLVNLGIILATGGLVHGLCLPFSDYTVGNFLARVGMCLAVPNGLWYLLYRKDPRFTYLRNVFLRLLRGGLRRVRGKGTPPETTG